MPLLRDLPTHRNHCHKSLMDSSCVLAVVCVASIFRRGAKRISLRTTEHPDTHRHTDVYTHREGGRERSRDRKRQRGGKEEEGGMEGKGETENR